MNQATANTVETSQFVTQLFPELGTAGIAAATAQYAGLGTNIFQADAMMGECEQQILPHDIVTITHKIQPFSYVPLICYYVHSARMPSR